MRHLLLLLLASSLQARAATNTSPMVKVAIEFIELSTTNNLPDLLEELGLGLDAFTVSNATGIVNIQNGRSSVLLDQAEKTNFLAAVMQQQADRVSAPRITMHHAQTGTIEVVREIIYPTEITATPADELGKQERKAAKIICGTAVAPDGFVTRKSGIICTVAPTVGPDNYTLELDLDARIIEEPNWKSVDLPFEAADGSTQYYPMPQPSFSERGIKGKLIIWTAHSVVGITGYHEVTVSIEDKVPLLGDIPLLGRLFSSRSTRLEKRMLVIVVEAEIAETISAGSGQ